MLDELLSTRQVAALLHVQPQTLAVWRAQGRGPSYVAVSSRKVLYRRAEIDRYLASRTRTSTSASGPPSAA